MHDNAPPHRSNHTLEWLENKSIKVMKRPAISSDLNPIENLSDLIDKKLKKMKLTKITYRTETNGSSYAEWYSTFTMQNVD